MATRVLPEQLKKGNRLFVVLTGFLAGSVLSVGQISNFFTAIISNPPEFLNTILSFSQNMGALLSFPLILVLLFLAVFGLPIYVIIGGIGYLLFAGAGEPLEIMPNEAYSMLISASIPAIPLFTLTGFILSESKAGERLVKLFRSLFSWIPGGLAVMAILVSGFFTTFTGASGVTILALGALLSYVLVKGKYKKKFSVGLLTASGSIGLLFPPSLPIIIYGVTAQISIKDMFVGGIIPGLLMITAIILYIIYYAKKNKVEKEPFNIREAAIAFKDAIWEVLLPFIILTSYFGGLTTLVESAGIAVIYTLVVEVVIKRDLKIRDLSNVVLKSIPIIGGVLIILACAKGLSYFIVDAEIPMQLTEWVKQNISSKYVFLLMLNLALLVTGMFMDIFSAIMVVVPLIIPLGEIFGIHPVHLGIIFLANMELGYLTPPIGLNLFLASYRFEEPV
ncbi:MAG: TRAP transporter large permease subunit, partial [Candidatus Aminicenantes bacterium]|nr:TRAP transporter large permease subunit [Candidatus Aminicenantes bacterium]